jgi:uncharacterized protein YecE (DUF72 family)
MAESTAMGAFYVGTSGFAFPEWKHGAFYPEGLKDREMLSYYSSRFRSVEINYTFRRHPAEKTLLTWRETTPEGFVFVVKAHQRITHTLRLAEPGDALPYFLERVRPLGDRLGPVLFQCPPSLKFDRERLEGFLAALPPELKAAFEFRHESWAEAKPLLLERGAAWCLAETDEQPYESPDLDSGAFVYLRLRRDEYQEEDLVAWSGRIRGALDRGTDVFCFVKHEEGAAGPQYAQRLTELVGNGAT